MRLQLTGCVNPRVSHSGDMGEKGCFIILNKAPYPFMEIIWKFDEPGSFVKLGRSVGDSHEHQRWKFIEAEGMPGAYYIKPAGDVGKASSTNCKRRGKQQSPILAAQI